MLLVQFGRIRNVTMRIPINKIDFKAVKWAMIGYSKTHASDMLLMLNGVLGKAIESVNE